MHKALSTAIPMAAMVYATVAALWTGSFAPVLWCAAAFGATFVASVATAAALSAAPALARAWRRLPLGILR